MVEYAPYADWYVRQAIIAFHDESVDIGQANKTVSGLFNGIKRNKEISIIEEAVSRGKRLSRLEEIQIDLWMNYQIRLEIVPRERILEINDFEKHIVSFGVSAYNFRTLVNIKFGVEEAKQIAQTLKLLPPAMLQGVKSICKFNSFRISLGELMDGTARQGEYLPESKTVVLYEATEELFGNSSPAQRALRIHVLLHEVGESLWPTLSDVQREEWKCISWGDEDIEKQSHFLTWYSHSNQRDDFCEHFACFVLYAPEFKESSLHCEAIRKKYQFIQALFRERTGKNIEYPKVFSFTIEELHGSLEQEVKKEELEGAMALVEEKLWQEEQAAHAHICTVVSSWEELAEKEFKKEAREDED